MLLGSDRYLDRARYHDGSTVPHFTVEQVDEWFKDMPSLRVGLLFDLIRMVKKL